MYKYLTVIGEDFSSDLSEIENNIKLLINKTSGSKLKVSELRKSESWKALLETDIEKFPDRFSAFLANNSSFVSILCLNMNMNLTSSYEEECPDAEFTSNEFNGLTPFLVLSDSKFTKIDAKRFLKNLKVKSLQGVYYPSRRELKNKNFEIYPFDKDSFLKMSSYHQKWKLLKDNFSEKEVEFMNKSTEKIFVEVDRMEKNTKLWGTLITGFILLVIVVGIAKFVSNSGSSSNSSSSNYSRQEQMDKLKKEAEDLYDKCQTFGKNYDRRC